MSRLLCLKHVALAVSVTLVCPQYSKKRSARLFFFFVGANQQLSLCHSFSVRLTSLLKFTQKAAKDYKPVLIPISERPLCGKIKDPLRTSDAVPVSLDSIYIYIHNIHINGQFSPCPFHMLFCFISSYMYGLYSVCASLLCETSKNTKQKRWQKHYREDKNSMLVKFWPCRLSCLFFLVANYWKITGLK